MSIAPTSSLRVSLPKRGQSFRQRPTQYKLHMQQDAGNVMPGSEGVIWLGADQRQTHRLHKEGLVP